jgi:hypothetical protein
MTAVSSAAPNRDSLRQSTTAGLDAHLAAMQARITRSVEEHVDQIIRVQMDIFAKRLEATLKVMMATAMDNMMAAVARLVPGPTMTQTLSPSPNCCVDELMAAAPQLFNSSSSHALHLSSASASPALNGQGTIHG